LNWPAKQNEGGALEALRFNFHTLFAEVENVNTLEGRIFAIRVRSFLYDELKNIMPSLHDKATYYVSNCTS